MARSRTASPRVGPTPSSRFIHSVHPMKAAGCPPTDTIGALSPVPVTVTPSSRSSATVRSKAARPRSRAWLLATDRTVRPLSAPRAARTSRNHATVARSRRKPGTPVRAGFSLTGPSQLATKTSAEATTARMAGSTSGTAQPRSGIKSPANTSRGPSPRVPPCSCAARPSAPDPRTWATATAEPWPVQWRHRTARRHPSPGDGATVGQRQLLQVRCPEPEPRARARARARARCRYRCVGWGAASGSGSAPATAAGGSDSELHHSRASRARAPPNMVAWASSPRKDHSPSE
jgi:hypothetical protein